MSKSLEVRTVLTLPALLLISRVQLRDLWMSDIALHGGAVARLDVLKDLSKMTLDVIGLAGAESTLWTHEIPRK